MALKLLINRMFYKQLSASSFKKKNCFSSKHANRLHAFVIVNVSGSVYVCIELLRSARSSKYLIHIG